MVLVHDEYGHFEGLVTPADVLEAIAGAFRADADTAEPGAVQREDGSWLLAGWLPADEMAQHLGLKLPPRRDYQTTAGYVLAAFERLPGVGEHVQADGWRFEVVDLDGNRIDKLLATHG
jgi:putative hemolysin